MAKPTPLSGFPELLPAAPRRRARGRSPRCSRTFELHGFANIETRAVEPLDRLRQGRRDRQGDLRPAPAAGRRDAGERRRVSGMHFDLTVPFARYVLENAGHLEFPFRRYQIQPAWRGERPQEGRYRQFTQADIDIVGRDELPFHHDVEVMRVMVEALGALPLPAGLLPGQQPQADPGLLPRARHPRRHGRDPRPSTSSTSCRAETVAELLVERRRRHAGAGAALPRAGHDPGPRHARSSSGCGRSASATSCSTQGLAELAAVRRGLLRRRQRPASTVEANLRIARGLDYYTGTVVEIFMERLRAAEVGRRRAAATTRSPPTAARRTPASASRSASRARWSRCIADGVLAGSRPVPSAVLVALADEESRAGQRRDRRRAARAAASPARWPPAPQKFGKQIRYAERRGIPFVWFPARGTTAPTRSRTSAPATRSTPTPPPGRRPTPTSGPRSSPDRTTRGDHSVIRTHDAGTLTAANVGRDRHARRLGGPPARPRRGGLHRPARGQRRRPGRDPRRGGRAQPAQRVLPQGHRRGRPAPIRRR